MDSTNTSTNNEVKDMLSRRLTILGHLQDLSEQLHKKGDAVSKEHADKIDKVLDMPRRSKRAALEGLVYEIERASLVVDFYEGYYSYGGPLDFLNWLINNFDTIMALIQKIVDLFSDE